MAVVLLAVQVKEKFNEGYEDGKQTVSQGGGSA